MSYLEAIILGIVEGLTEFLPISSTGHLILSAELLRLKPSDFLSTFEIAVQVGAILSVVFLYWKKLLRPEVIKKVAVAFIPTGILGATLYRLVKDYLLGSVSVVLWALLVGGVVLIIFERFYKQPENDQRDGTLTYKQAFLVGLFQSIAFVPGVSRAAATIIGGLCIGLRRREIVEFSFLLSVPTMLAATGLDLINARSSFGNNELGLLFTGLVTAFVVAVFGIKFLLGYIQKHSFAAFGYYRIILAILFFIFIVG